MSARRIDGRAAAAALRERIAGSVAEFERQSGRAPGLATVLVGEDPASAVYVRMKGKATLEAGMQSFAHKLPTRSPKPRRLVTNHRDERVDGTSSSAAARPGRPAG